MIEYHNPDARVGVDEIPYTLSTTIRAQDSINIAFLANGFPDSQAFLDKLAAEMQAVAPGIKPFIYNKGNATIPAGEALLGEINQECSAAIAAYGH